MLQNQVEEISLTQGTMIKAAICKISLGIWLFLFWFYVLGSTANFTRDVFGHLGNKLFIYLLILNGLIVLVSIFFNYNHNKVYFYILLVISLLTGWYMIGQLFNPNLQRGWLYPDVRVTRTRYSKDLGLFYRFTSLNFRQKDKEGYLQYKFNYNSKFNHLPLPYLPNIISYTGYKERLNEQGERLFPNTLKIGLVERKDSLLFVITEYNMLDVFYIEENFKGIRYLGEKGGGISQISSDKNINSSTGQNSEKEILKIFEKEDTTIITINDSIL